MANFFSRLFGKNQAKSKAINQRNAQAIANLFIAAQKGIDALTEASLKEDIECNSCGNKFIAALGMKTGGRSTIVCPKCQHLIFTR